MGTVILNGWDASPAAWSLCACARGARVCSYLEQLEGAAQSALDAVDGKVLLIGWSMGGSHALHLACKYREKLAGLILVAATPRMMEDKSSGWRGMSPRRLEAFLKGVELTQGQGLFGPPEGRPNPYCADTPANLRRGLDYLLNTDLRGELENAFAGRPPEFPVGIFHSERDGIVRPENATYLKMLFPRSELTWIPGSEHALPVAIPELIDAAAASMINAG